MRQQSEMCTLCNTLKNNETLGTAHGGELIVSNDSVTVSGIFYLLLRLIILFLIYAKSTIVGCPRVEEIYD